MHSRTFVFRFSIVLCLASIMSTGPAIALAAPNTETPTELLSVRKHPRSQQLLADAARLYETASKQVEVYATNLSEGRYKSGTAREMKNISQTFNHLVQLDRIAQDLQLLGEPAGIDLAMRVTVLQGRLGESIRAYKQLPKSSEVISSASRSLQTFAKQKERALPTVEKLLDDGKGDAAIKLYNETRDEVAGPTAWQNSIIAGEILRPFNALSARVLSENTKLRTAEAQEILLAMRAKQIPPFDRFLENVDGSVKSVGETGTATWGGQMLEGPQLLSAWMVGWKQAHLMSLRAQVLTWSLPDGTELDPPDTLANDYDDFHARMIAACAALIEADAARVQPADAPGLYTQYLQSLAQIVPRMSDDTLRNAVAPGLVQLKDVSPDFSRKVANYTRATSRVLRWRKRKAEAWRRSHEKESALLEQLLAKAAQPDAISARPGRDARIDQLRVAAPPLVEDVSSVAVDKLAFVNQVATGGEAPILISRHEKFSFGTSERIEVPAAEIEALKRDLLVTPTSLPLTLDAAIAIAAAEQGYFAAAGGKVKLVELESQIGRVLHLDEKAVFPIGALISEQPKEPLLQLSWRAELVPQWAQHEYLFVIVP